ncbi:NUDIX domain-containing protein [Colletotrichum graminicola M1.001]|uniref:NUDIX domain-containing protein n=1 Tax=Colletotrichum graminicola (strain M1.001 / M2 / FGSC 10212) TaxID=645133 RepID=E3Q630_COLGM|nr:NUDIX domain-containing protein [Colletotrichum graminicola M1.001]EFQ26278.1 NUDIX domain-containing protein [Colletotrichum graminicola M1.001]
MSQAAATDPSPAPTSPPSFSEDAAAATTGTTTTATASPALQQQHQDHQLDEATPLTAQDVHEITAHLAAAAKHPSAATSAVSPSPAAGVTAATTPATPSSASSKRGDIDDSTANPNPEGVLILDDDDEEVTSYWDAEAMAPLNPVSAAAISRLRRYVPPAFPLWDRLPVSRRAAVLILLYADRRGDLRVVITMRAASLRSFSGHAAFPGGKADTIQETPYEIARREAWEEIGLPMDDARIPKPFKIEPLCYLPYNLARTELVVRPCVAFLHADEEPDENPSPLVEERMIPRLDAKEVAAVFSAPFQNFLRARDAEPHGNRALPPGHWYDGSWIQWKDHPWRVHNFYVPVDDQRVTTPGNAMEADHPQSNLAEKLEEDKVGRFKVWGLTAHMLVDAARIAYGKEPEFECNSHFGDEEIILQAEREGSLVDKKRKRDEAAATGTTEEKAEPAKM